MNIETNKAVVRQFIEAINQQDFLRLDAFVSSEVVRHGAPPAKYLKGLTKLQEFLRGELAIFPDAYETIHFLIGEGEMVAAYLGFHGTQTGNLGSFPPSGKTLETDFMCIFRLENSKISEIWALWDRLDALNLLGHLLIDESRQI
ncbi:MAG: ester cyclase [Xenococcaceae cyanobacterium MO_167.B27]|nr:ester cyclase [Xenococcaceae cyanobacterium MO_167.B27]